MADFSKLTPKLRAVLYFRANGYTNMQIAGLGVRYSVVCSRLDQAKRCMEVSTVDEAVRAWNKHPQKDNESFWMLVDTLRETAKEWRPKRASSLSR